MASYHHHLLQQHSNPRVESPAKVFAKLKSKVQREAMCARERSFTNTDPLSSNTEKHGAECRSPWKTAGFTNKDPLSNNIEKHGAEYSSPWKKAGFTNNDPLSNNTEKRGEEYSSPWKKAGFTNNDPLSNNTEKRGEEYSSPRKKARCAWMTDELEDNQKFDSYRNEAQALTLSPISSPQKSCDYSYSRISNKRLEEISQFTETRHGSTRREGAFLESTALSQTLSCINRNQVHKGPPQIRDLDRCKAVSRTPVKIKPQENHCERNGFEEDGVDVFSPQRRKLRMRNWEQRGFNKINSIIEEAEDKSHPRERKTSAFRVDDIHTNPDTRGLGHVRGFSADRGEMIHEPLVSPLKSTTVKHCSVVLDQLPPMSPAKMFVYMKERESNKELETVRALPNARRKNLFNGGHFHQSRDTPLSTTQDMGEMEDVALKKPPVNGVPVNPDRVDSADSQSDINPSEHFQIPAEPPQPILLEDPLVLKSPKIFIPKKNEDVFKRNKGFKQEKFPSESVIHLKQWFLRKNSNGLFVDGIHREDNIAWNSNIIMERVSTSVLKTVTGRVYVLVGKMKMKLASDFPSWFLKKFAKGFPANWKSLYEKLLSESIDDQSAGTAKCSKGRGSLVRKKSDSSSINQSLKRQKQEPAVLKTPDSCPSTSLSSAKVSRSGRVIKPPLEYWKGGRVIVDAFMNVTIHEGYDTSFCIPEVTTTVSKRAAQKPARAFLPCSEDCKQNKSRSDEETAVPLRKVKPPLHKHKRSNSGEKPSGSLQAPVEALTIPEEANRRTRSSTRSPSSERELFVSQKQSKPEKSSKQRSRQQSNSSSRSSARSSGGKRVVSSSPESSVKSDQTSQHLSPKDEIPIKRKTRGKPACLASSTWVFEPSVSVKKTRVTKHSDKMQTKEKQSKCTETSPPTQTLPKSTQSRKKHKANKGNTVTSQEEDEDQWSEAELMRLQQAVSYYPKHMAGYWAKVARMVRTRSPEECHNQHTSQATSQSPHKKSKKPAKKKVEAAKVSEHPVISARAGTLRRKQQVREFLEAMPREDVEDVFSSAYMQNKRFEIPSMCPSEEYDFAVSDMEPHTPASTWSFKAKTPQCLHITPGMMGSPNRDDDDKYVYQLQKRMKKKQFDAGKCLPSSKDFTPSVKQTMRRCVNSENDTFVVWEMFPEKDGLFPEGEEEEEEEEEEDYYFSDHD